MNQKETEEAKVLKELRVVQYELVKTEAKRLDEIKRREDLIKRLHFDMKLERKIILAYVPNLSMQSFRVVIRRIKLRLDK